jgi:hypothetical protein
MPVLGHQLLVVATFDDAAVLHRPEAQSDHLAALCSVRKRQNIKRKKFRSEHFYGQRWSFL